MRLWIGLFLMLLGGAIVLAGMGIALRQLIGLYAGVLDDPLGQPEGTEDAAQQAMFRGLILGATGVLPFIVGSALVKGAIVRRLRRASRKH